VIRAFQDLESKKEKHSLYDDTLATSGRLRSDEGTAHLCSDIFATYVFGEAISDLTSLLSPIALLAVALLALRLAIGSLNDGMSASRLHARLLHRWLDVLRQHARLKVSVVI
jgi:hypothetical protein